MNNKKFFNIDFLSSLNFFDNIKNKIKKKSSIFFLKIKNFFLNNKLDDNFFDKLQDHLIMCDFGFDISNKIIKKLIYKHKCKSFENTKEIYLKLKIILLNMLNVDTLHINTNSNKSSMNIIILVGVNGVGKTTTAAKLAYFYKKSGKSVILSASDTFRFASIEQLKKWGNDLDILVFYKKYGTNSSSVIFDSIKYAKKNKFDILIIDTAGRLHNKINLMEELKKNIRVVKKYADYSFCEIFLVLDACNGHNSIIQTEKFCKSINNISGIVLTKLDGSAKGGIIFSILEKFSIPIKYIACGNKKKDLYLFDTHKFIDNLFP